MEIPEKFMFMFKKLSSSQQEKIRDIGRINISGSEHSKELLMEIEIKRMYLGTLDEEGKEEYLGALAEDNRSKIKKKYDQSGKRICDEIGCYETEDVRKCNCCSKYVCKKHRYDDVNCVFCFD